MPMLCERPHPNFVDYETSRFVVSVDRGLLIDGRTYGRGEEVPKGALPSRYMYLEYSAFCLETFEHALKDASLREACARMGTVLEPPKVIEELDVKTEDAPARRSVTRSKGRR